MLKVKIVPFWPENGPNLVQMAKIEYSGVETKTRPLSYAVLSPEFEFCMKILNTRTRRAIVDHFGQKMGQLWSKWPALNIVA